MYEHEDVASSPSEVCQARPGPLQVTVPVRPPLVEPSSSVVNVMLIGVAVVRAQMGPDAPGIQANALTGTHSAGSIHNHED